MSKKGNEKLLEKFSGVFDETKFYVYRISNDANSKLYYGKTDDPHNRWGEHKRAAKSRKPKMLIARAMKKYGSIRFAFEVIEVLDSDVLASQKEISWIARDKTNMCRYGKNAGYNQTDGGEADDARWRNQ